MLDELLDEAIGDSELEKGEKISSVGRHHPDTERFRVQVIGRKTERKERERDVGCDVGIARRNGGNVFADTVA